MSDTTPSPPRTAHPATRRHTSIAFFLLSLPFPGDLLPLLIPAGGGGRGSGRSQELLVGRLMLHELVSRARDTRALVCRFLELALRELRLVRRLPTTRAFLGGGFQGVDDVLLRASTARPQARPGMLRRLVSLMQDGREDGFGVTAVG